MMSHLNRTDKGIFFCLTTFFFLLVSCHPTTGVQELATPVSPTATSPVPTKTPFNLPTPTSVFTPEITVLPSLQVCSPLEGYSLDILDTITNPFNPPAPGSDEPHQAVDLSDLIENRQIAVEGRTINAILSGWVAGVIRDRFPYGNALMVETPLDDISPEWLEHLQLPTPAPTTNTNTALVCPQTREDENWHNGNRSLYLLYAHLQEEPLLHPGDWIVCAQALGAIGMSGNALNPHLHLEIRVGPSGVRFTSMAHYDTSASLEEMENYCLWRVSNLFQPVDPLKLFTQP